MLPIQNLTPFTFLKNEIIGLTGKQKLVAAVALGVLSTLAVVWAIYKATYCTLVKQDPSTNLEFDGQLKGKIIYPFATLKVEGDQITLNKDGFLEGQARVIMHGNKYEGYFEKGHFVRGKFTGLVENKKYEFEIKGFNQLENIFEILEDGVKCEVKPELRLHSLIMQPTYLFYIGFSTRQFQLEGNFKGQVRDGQRAIEMDIDGLKWKDANHFSGNGKIQLGANSYEGEFKSGALEKGIFTGTVNEKEFEVQLSPNIRFIRPKNGQTQVDRVNRIALNNLLDQPILTAS
jgi:hypothetical protein